MRDERHEWIENTLGDKAMSALAEMHKLWDNAGKPTLMICNEAGKAHLWKLCTHRKETTMNREGARHLRDALAGIDALDGLVDLLVHEGAVERVDEPCKKSAILEEDWSLEDDGFVYYHGDNIDEVISYGCWDREIAALPDCLRALVGVRQCETALFSTELWQEIRAALEKAGVS